MKIVIIGNDNQKTELNNTAEAEVIWVHNVDYLQGDADVVIDLLFIADPERIGKLKNINAPIKIINSVTHTLEETGDIFIRINGWPTFLKSPVIEAAAKNYSTKLKAEKVFNVFNKDLHWLHDEVGFITPRVISMIINEAYMALGEGVSTKDEINTAMKLGTAYPYGPFEWANEIGLSKISDLLIQLSKRDQKYLPCNRLQEEAEKK